MTPTQHPAPVPTEEHPLRPFLPPHARLLMLGSFPPPRKRWCMDFYYPNFINDMWRVMGHIYHGDRNWFVDERARCFKKEAIVEFLLDKGIALYDTASAVRRLQDNASDKFLEVAAPADLPRLLARIPRCTAIATTGQKATDTLCDTLHISQPAIGNSSPFVAEGRELRLYRMPSTSRAYPMKLETKADFYRKMLEETGLL